MEIVKKLWARNFHSILRWQRKFQEKQHLFSEARRELLCWKWAQWNTCASKSVFSQHLRFDGSFWAFSPAINLLKQISKKRRTPTKIALDVWEISGFIRGLKSYIGFPKSCHLFVWVLTLKPWHHITQFWKFWNAVFFNMSFMVGKIDHVFQRFRKKDTKTHGFSKIPTTHAGYGLFRRRESSESPRCLCLPLRRSLQHLGCLELHGFWIYPINPPAALINVFCFFSQLKEQRISSNFERKSIDRTIKKMSNYSK